MLWRLASIPRSAIAAKVHGSKGDTGELKADRKKREKQNPDTITR